MPRSRIDIPVEQLRQLYCGEGKSMKEIANIFRTNRETIRKRLRSEGIPARGRGRPKTRLFPA
jgi:transposase